VHIFLTGVFVRFVL